jgi:hypothetical protein
VPALRNPFKPTFGSSPPLLVGRQTLLEDFTAALDDGPGSPDRASLYTGARGTGKTVMLNEVEGIARERGWLVVAETATPGLLTRLVQEALPTLLSSQDPEATRTRLSGVTLGPLGADWNTSNRYVISAGLRTQITALADILATNETGLLITVDELHHKPSDDLIILCATIQHMVREEKEVAFAGAGLPAAISELLNEQVLTFLRRASRHHLGSVAREQVAEALRQPIEDRGRAISAEALEEAVAGTSGYPFLIQLVGHSIWRQHPAEEEISHADVAIGVAYATRRLGALVHAQALQDCSAVDRSYLLAMAKDVGPSNTGDVARRLGVNAQYAGQYRQRLIDADLITSEERGKVDFTVPFMREYMREHAAISQLPG